MPQSTVLLAVKEFVDSHPDFPEDYFDAEHRPKTRFFTSKVYLSRVGNGWQLVELNPFQLFINRFSAIVSFGFYKSYGNIVMSSFKSELQPAPYDEGIPETIKHLYEALMTKALGRDKAWTDARDTVDPVHEKPLSYIDLLNQVSQETDSAAQAQLQERILYSGKRNYRAFFESIDQMNSAQREAFVRLLSVDVTLSLGIWDGIMYHGKAFAMSTREHVRSWIPDFIRALTLDQLKKACTDSKFWEVVGLFPEQFGSELSLDQWTCIIEHNRNADLIGKVMLSLPVDHLLYDKLLVACGKIPVDHGKELAMKGLIIRLSRYLKSIGDNRSTEVLSEALNKAPQRRMPMKPQRAATAPALQHERTMTRTPSLAATVPVRIPVPKLPHQPQWEQEHYIHVAHALNQHVSTQEEAKTLFWETLVRVPNQMEIEEVQASLNHLIRYYPSSVFGQMDDMTEVELHHFLMALEQTNPESIVDVFDVLMRDARELGLSKELFARNKAQRILKYITPGLLEACITTDKLRAVLQHYPDLAGPAFGVEHLQIVSSLMKNPYVLAKIISHLPLNETLGDKLAVICPYVVNDASLQLQVSAKIMWFSTHFDKNKASELQDTVERALYGMTAPSARPTLLS